MRQMVHEHPFNHPGRVLHVRKPEFTTFISRGGLEFARPGLLGVSPIVHVPRPLPRHVVPYPLHACPPPDAIARHQEHVRALEHLRAPEHVRAIEHVCAPEHVRALERVCASEHVRALERVYAPEHVRAPEPVPLHPPLAENFFQTAWLKGIQRDKKRGHTRNHGARNYSNGAKLKKGSSTVAKKGFSLADTLANLCKEQEKAEAKHDVGTSKEVEMLFKEQSAAEKKTKEQHVGASSSIEQSISEIEHMDAHMDEKTSIEDLEEGEIGAESPEQLVNVDANESPGVSGEGGTNHLNSDLESVDNAECKIGFGSSEQIVNVVSEEDPQQLENDAHTSEKEIVSLSNTVSYSVDITEQKNVGIPSVDMNDTLSNTSSAEVFVQNAANCSTHVPHAKRDCQIADMHKDGNCLENQIAPPVQELLVSTKLEPVEFDGGSSIEAVAKPEERSGNVMESSSTACDEALERICSDSNMQRLIETCSNEHREDPAQIHSSSTILEAGTKPQEESIASITRAQILATLMCILPESACLALADKASAVGNNMQGLVPFLSEISGVLESFEKGNSCSKNRDPRRGLKASCFGELEGCPQHVALAKECTVQKRKYERQEGVEKTPSKRLCIEREIASESKLDDQLNYQEPIDMEIDSSDPAAYASIEACFEATSERNASREDDTLQMKPSGSEHSLVMDPAKPRLRSRDPRRALIDRGKVKIGSLCGGETHGPSETSPCVSDSERVLQERKKVSNPSSMTTLCEGVSSWENIHFEGLTDEQLEAVYVERARRIDEQNRMLNSKKLCLVLDLDHTLLNSAKFSEVDKFKAVLCEMEAADRRSVDNPLAKRDLYRYPKLGMWTKLRPGIWDFLSRASRLYELHVYTMGNKAYATEMAKLLDPTGTLFAGRVISRGDDNDRTFNSDVLPKSKDLDGVLGLESAVIIIDDSVQVWPHHWHNLLVVERYMYFPSSRRQFGLSGPSLLEIKHDERAADGMLASVLKVIEKIHHRFFANQWLHEVDVRRILAMEKQSVLAGCKIVFSRVYPQGESQPHLHPLWQTAEQFGAVCTTNIDDGVTHVVAISRGTDKVKWAMRTGRFSVCPAWLEASAVLYRRANECDFPVPL